MVTNKQILVLFMSGGLLTVIISMSYLNQGLEKHTRRVQLHTTSDHTEHEEDVIRLGQHTDRRARDFRGNKSTSSENGKTSKQLRNVLFIIVDDLRPQLGAYHDPEHPDYFSKLKIHTPNLDRLASQSAVFKHAYTQYSLCGPSRTSLLTGRRPDVTRVYNNNVYWRTAGGNFTTLPQHFKNKGYITIGLGKVFHPGISSNNNDPPSWVAPYIDSLHRNRHYLKDRPTRSWLAVPKSERQKVPLVDDRTTRLAKKMLRKMAEGNETRGRPFFMAIGYNKPHLSMICPAEYFELYPLEDADDFLANASWRRPLIRPAVHIDHITTYKGERVVPPNELRNLRRAYFACISYIDGLVGDVIDELARLGLTKKTVVSFMADHGFHLGENRHWGKVTTWELSTRVPMIIRVPGLTDSGSTLSTPVETLDIFPTLVEAAGLDPIPPCPTRCRHVKLCAQGVSLMSLMKADAVGSSQRLSKDAAFSQTRASDGMKYTIRTKRYRLVERAQIHTVRQDDGTQHTAIKWHQTPNTSELYDHNSDILEQTNLIQDGRYADIIADLRNRLHTFVEDILL